MPLRNVARIEPVVLPGEVRCTEAAKSRLENDYYIEQTIETYEKLGPPNEKGQYSIRKRDSDEKAEWVLLYRVLPNKPI